jgi:hypothetical protein
VQRTDAQRPRTEDDQEWDNNVEEAAYEGATAYSPTSYERSNGYFWVSNEASRRRRMLRQEARAALPSTVLLPQTAQTVVRGIEACEKG